MIRLMMAVPMANAPLSAVPKTLTANSLTNNGEWSMTTLPTEAMAEGTRDVIPAMSSVRPKASPAETTPAKPARVDVVFIMLAP
jgi:hypothetical protein